MAAGDDFAIGKRSQFSLQRLMSSQLAVIFDQGDVADNLGKGVVIGGMTRTT